MSRAILEITQQLRELEADGILLRKVSPEVPPRADYTLSEKCLSLLPVIHIARIGGEANL